MPHTHAERNTLQHPSNSKDMAFPELLVNKLSIASPVAVLPCSLSG